MKPSVRDFAVVMIVAIVIATVVGGRLNAASPRVAKARLSAAPIMETIVRTPVVARATSGDGVFEPRLSLCADASCDSGVGAIDASVLEHFSVDQSGAGSI
jgi:hypothetical protein